MLHVVAFELIQVSFAVIEWVRRF